MYTIFVFISDTLQTILVVQAVLHIKKTTQFHISSLTNRYQKVLIIDELIEKLFYTIDLLDQQFIRPL